MKTFPLFLLLLSQSRGFSLAPPMNKLQHSGSTSSMELGMSGFMDMFHTKPAASKKQQKQKDRTTNKAKSKKNWIEKMMNEPLHGGGNGEKELDELYATQQKIHRERQNFKPKAMRKKYKVFGKDHLRDIKTIDHDPASLNKQEDNAMWINDGGSKAMP